MSTVYQTLNLMQFQTLRHCSDFLRTAELEHSTSCIGHAIKTCGFDSRSWCSSVYFLPFVDDLVRVLVVENN
jgi:hypothetical protein